MACYTGEGGSCPPQAYWQVQKWFLCRACRLISRDELANIKFIDESDYASQKEITLLEWYIDHCELESNKPELERIKGKPEPIPKKVYPY